MRHLRHLNTNLNTINLHVRAIALAHDFASRWSYLPYELVREPDVPLRMITHLQRHDLPLPLANLSASLFSGTSVAFS